MGFESSVFRHGSVSKIMKTKSKMPGKVYQYLHHNNNIGSSVLIRTKTDFALRSECVDNLARDICLQVAALNDSNIDSLLESNWLKDSSLTVKELIHNVEEQIKEPIVIEKINRMAV